MDARQRKCASPIEACAAISMPDVTFSFFHQKYGILKDEYVGSLVHTLSKYAEVSRQLAVLRGHSFGMVSCSAWAWQPSAEG